MQSTGPFKVISDKRRVSRQYKIILHQGFRIDFVTPPVKFSDVQRVRNGMTGFENISKPGVRTGCSTYIAISVIQTSKISNLRNVSSLTYSERKLEFVNETLTSRGYNDQSCFRSIQRGMA